MSVFLDGVTDVERTLGLDVTGLRTLSESDAVHDIVGFIVYQFQLDVFLFTSYHLAGTIIVYMVRTEYRFVVVRPKRIESLQVRMEFWSDITEIYFSIDVDDRTSLFRQDVVGYIFLESAGEFFHIFRFHRQAGSIGMSTEVFQQIATMLDGLVHIESRDRTCRTGSQIIGTSENHSRTIVYFSQTGCHDTNHALVPFLVEDNDGTAFGQVFQLFDNLVGFLGHGLVQILAGFVVLVDLVGFFQGSREVLFYQ